MNDKPAEISDLTASELAVELAHTASLLMAAPSLPFFGYEPDPVALSAVKARHSALTAELDRRVMP